MRGDFWGWHWEGCGGGFGRQVAPFREEERPGCQLRCQFRYSQAWTSAPAFIYEKGPASSLQLSPCGSLTSFFFTWLTSS